MGAGAAFAEPPPLPDATRVDERITAAWQQGTRVQREPARETWAGAEAFRHVWSLYTGATYAPFSNLRQDGLRLRAVSALSGYSYAGLRFDPSAGAAIWQTFRGQSRTVDLLAGYQWRTGDLTIKTFAGYRNASVEIAPFDPETTVQGQRHGAIGALELWFNITPRQWTSLDLTYATPFRSYAHRLRVADRISETMSIGVEAAALGHQEGSTQRAGAFLRFDNGVHEISASAGWSMPRGEAGHAYGTAQWLVRF